MKEVFIYIIGCACSLLMGFIMGVNHMQERITPELGNSISNIGALKIDCEKSLPRDQECVMVFDFVPAKKEKSE